MKALTLTEPWATLVAMDVKCWETRSWTWKTELNTIEERADSLVANLARHLDRLPPARLAVWRSVEGWGEDWTGEEIAAWVWDQGRTERISLLAAPF